MSLSARLFYLWLWERWGRQGKTCWETQERLASQVDVNVRTVRGWEASLRRAGWISVSYVRRGRSEIRVMAFERNPDAQEGASTLLKAPSPGPQAPTEHGSPGYSGSFKRTGKTVHPGAQGHSPGPGHPPTTRTGRDHKQQVRAVVSSKGTAAVRGALQRAERLGVHSPGVRYVREALQRAWCDAESEGGAHEVFEAFVDLAFHETNGARNAPGALVAILRDDQRARELLDKARSQWRGSRITEEDNMLRWDVKVLECGKSPESDRRKAQRDLDRRGLTLQEAKERVASVFESNGAGGQGHA